MYEYEFILDFQTCMHFLKNLQQRNYYSRFWLNRKQNFLLEICETIDRSRTHDRTNHNNLRWYGTVPSSDILSSKLNNENDL